MGKFVRSLRSCGVSQQRLTLDERLRGDGRLAWTATLGLVCMLRPPQDSGGVLVKPSFLSSRAFVRQEVLSLRSCGVSKQRLTLDERLSCDECLAWSAISCPGIASSQYLFYLFESYLGMGMPQRHGVLRFPHTYRVFSVTRVQ